MSKLKIYKASAGSGKTHTLTEEYLKLAANFPNNFKRILAVTFTNKAAEEMKQRILEALNEIIFKGEEASFYHVFSVKYNSENEKAHIARANKLRDNILHDYSFFSLSTIDSFVQKVIKSFTYEIGVESGYKIELDTEKVLGDLTELLYKQIDTDKDLRTWLIHFANFKMDEGKNWDFRLEINKLAREIFKEQFDSDSSEVNENHEFEFILKYFDQLKAIRINFEESMADLGNLATKLIADSGIDLNLHSNNIKILYNYLTNYLINPSNQDYYIPNGTVIKLIDKAELWYTKTAKEDIRISSKNVYDLLNPLIAEAIAIINRDYKIYLSAINLISAFHAFGILRKLSSLLPSYRAENNLLLISDTTRILKEIVEGNDAPFIYEKIGNRYNHVLIDEFQDTSGFQWENFKPLIKNGLSEGNENLIVGDIKQSIYRWRGGDWNILMSKLDSDIGELYIQHENLETNWRSKKNIVDFNNSLFARIAELMQQVFDSELNEGADGFESTNEQNQFEGIISKAYADVRQKLPKDAKKTGGRVKVQFFKMEKGDLKSDWHEKLAVELPKTIETLLKQKNYQPGDVAILVRRNSEGKEIARILLDFQHSNPEAVPYQIISSESLMLINSPAIQVLINSMYYILDPSDKIHLHALITVYDSIINNGNDISHIHFGSNDFSALKQLLPEGFFEKSEDLKKLNVYELSELLCQIFEINRLVGQQAYLQSFQDLILDFDQNEQSDLGAFLSWWEDKGQSVAVQLAEQQDAVKILSIHKSKGLAFRIVIVPYCDWEIKPQPFLNNIIWTSSEIEPFNQFKRFPVVYRKYLQKSIFWKEYYEELLYSMIDALNMLYVAYTRPKEELIVMAPIKNGKTEKQNSVADLLYQAIVHSKKSDDLIDLSENYLPDEGIFELKDGYHDFDENKFVKQITSKSNFSIDEFSIGDWNSKISILHHADDFFVKSLAYIQTHIDYGNLMHDIFSKIKEVENIEGLIDEFYYAGKIGNDERKSMAIKVKEMIERPSVSDWFSDRWEVKTESAILAGSGVIRIPDRVLIGENETLVIDFKFGKQDPDSVNQVREYMDLLKGMNYPKVKGFIYYAEKNLVEEVF
jgi:ATP-dependent exoDNAse (exonuclease V) beta subunit